MIQDETSSGMIES